jgi:hypothetical protein
MLAHLRAEFEESSGGSFDYDVFNDNSQAGPEPQHSQGFRCSTSVIRCLQPIGDEADTSDVQWSGSNGQAKICPSKQPYLPSS